MKYRRNKVRTRSKKAESKEMRYGSDGLNISTYSRFPKSVKNAFVSGWEAAKASYGRDAFSERTDSKAARKAVFNDIRENASQRDQLYLSEANDSGKAFRKGVRQGIAMIQSETLSGRTEYGMRFNPAMSDFSPKYKRRMTKMRSSAWEQAPSAKSEMKRSPSGTLTWDVKSAHGTDWRYIIRKLKAGYVVEFKSRRSGSVAKYINVRGVATSTSNREFYRTQNEAFRAMARHIMDGKHLPFKNNPRRRR
jgi:hypothetical protein